MTSREAVRVWLRRVQAYVHSLRAAFDLWDFAHEFEALTLSYIAHRVEAERPPEENSGSER